MKGIELDGRTGEGGGQLVRVAVGLAALTLQPIKITNVRGNRPGSRNGGSSWIENLKLKRKNPQSTKFFSYPFVGIGLKSQHVAAIKWLADVTEADVEGLHVGSKTVTFAPRRSPTELLSRNISIRAETGAASVVLIAQAILPYLLYAGNDRGEPIFVELSGGTNVSFSPSYEYFDQVLMPTLEERFGIRVDRELKARGWSLGPLSRGTVALTIQPIPKGKRLQYKSPPQYKYPDSYDVVGVDVSIIAPSHAHTKAQEAVIKDLEDLWPGVEVDFKLMEDSERDTRWSILLVARSADGLRWARDVLESAPKGVRQFDAFVTRLSGKLCKELYEEVSVGGQVDRHLQDQIVCFQALCDGFSSFPRGGEPEDTPSMESLVDQMGKLYVLDDRRMRREKTIAPFGHGSKHTQTARWVIGEILPKVEFYNKGDLVKGVGFSL